MDISVHEYKYARIKACANISMHEYKYAPKFQEEVQQSFWPPPEGPRTWSARELACVAREQGLLTSNHKTHPAHTNVQ